MPNREKVQRVAALRGRIEGANALLLAEYRGLSVHDATELRRALSDTARFSVVKNTLMQRAAGEAGIQELEPLLSGPTAVAFVQGDVVAAAKRVADAAKKFPALVLKGAYLDGKVLDASAAQALASLESREVMLSRIAGMLKAEMSRAASMFQTLQGRFLGVLEAYKEKLPSAEEPTAVPKEPAASAGADAEEPPAVPEEAAEANEAPPTDEETETSEAEVSANEEE
ncbi:MAG: 50S ribosomal protein L10 [Actinomycetota bacterium]